jgi:hypothetical protein
MSEVHIATGKVLLTTNVEGIDVRGELRTSPAAHENDGSKQNKWVLSGSNDMYPNELRQDAESDTVILPGLRLNAKLLYGGGLTYGRFVAEDNGRLDWKFAYDPKIEQWMRGTNIARQLLTIFYDVKFGGMAYPLFTKSVDGKIHYVRT